MVDKIELKALLEAPEGTSFKNSALLTSLAAQYPYFQPLHLLLAKANMGQPSEKQLLANAALYTNGQLLHKVIFKAHELKEFPIVLAKNDLQVEEQVVTEIPVTEIPEEELQPVFNQEVNEDLMEMQETDTEGASYEQVVYIESEQVEAEGATLDDQEIYDEIGEVDLHTFTQDGTTGSVLDPISKIETPEEDFVLENIVASDFFAFEKTLQPEIRTEPTAEENFEEQHKVSIANNHVETEAHVALNVSDTEDDSRISNYHDDKLPYTFLWWLEKTRKEHQAIFQPYAAPKRQSSNELQQQYVEHIFHIQSPFNPEEILNNTPEAAHSDPKEVDIIDSFIRNAPQIGIPRGEQIDNENKARKSAEDHNDLVTETLAKIYIEQMLYHKAIDTYEKLSLKFPEKSRYFADLIQSIKKKI
jgi:hypothetical protein